MLKNFLFILIALVLASCSGPRKKATETSATDSVQVENGKNPVAPVIPSAVDSFEIIYYKKPYKDSSRYSRFFLVLTIRDSAVIQELNRTFIGSFEKLSEVKKCLSEGKLIIPLGGEAYRTIFFSRIETACPYIYFIKDGEFYYYEIRAELNEKLNILEKLAVEPK